jgi:tRNA threonylcarbamoyladenosine biosynthesis protein TsaE
MKVSNLKDLKIWADSFFSPLRNEKTVFLLEGEMGAGKTELVRCIGVFMGWKDVSSPTYSLINEYGDGFAHHCDLYRIQEPDELEGIGFWEIFNKKSGWVFVEWPSKMDIKRIPPTWKIIRICINPKSESEREIVIS